MSETQINYINLFYNDIGYMEELCRGEEQNCRQRIVVGAIVGVGLVVNLIIK